MGPRLGMRKDPMPLLSPEADAAQPASARRLECSILVLEAQRQSYPSATIVPLLEAQGSAAGELEPKQQEGEPMPDAAMPRLHKAK